MSLPSKQLNSIRSVAVNNNREVYKLFGTVCSLSLIFSSPAETQEKSPTTVSKQTDGSDESIAHSSKDRGNTVVSKSYMGASCPLKRKHPYVNDSIPCFPLVAVMCSQRRMRTYTLNFIFDNPYHRVVDLFFLNDSRCAVRAICHSAATASLRFRVVFATNSITAAAVGVSSIRWTHLPGDPQHRSHGSVRIAWLTRTLMSMITIRRSGWTCTW